MTDAEAPEHDSKSVDESDERKRRGNKFIVVSDAQLSRVIRYFGCQIRIVYSQGHFFIFVSRGSFGEDVCRDFFAFVFLYKFICNKSICIKRNKRFF